MPHQPFARVLLATIGMTFLSLPAAFAQDYQVEQDFPAPAGISDLGVRVDVVWHDHGHRRRRRAGERTDQRRLSWST